MAFERQDGADEKRRRICVALWAYAYEIMDDPLVPDEMFDRICREIDIDIPTDRPNLDQWFREQFDPSTGMWIHRHPEMDGIRRIYTLLTGNPSRSPSGEKRVRSAQSGADIIYDPAGCNSYFMNMVWLASLGFRVIPGTFHANDFSFHYEFEPDAMRIWDGRREKRILYTDIFSHRGPISDR